MANTMAPFGFRQFRRLDGGAPTAGFDTLTIASSDTNLYFTGDPVVTSATGPYITVLSTAQVIVRGIFMGCEFFSPTFARKVWSPFFPGSVQTSSGTADAQAWVCTDPEMMYIVQCSSIATVGSSQIGLNTGPNMSIALLSSQGNQTTGVSVTTLSTIATTNSSAPFRIMDLYSNWAPPGTNGTDNTSVGNIVIVAPNNFDRKAGQTGI